VRPLPFGGIVVYGSEGIRLASLPRTFDSSRPIGINSGAQGLEGTHSVYTPLLGKDHALSNPTSLPTFPKAPGGCAGRIAGSAQPTVDGCESRLAGAFRVAGSAQPGDRRF
jgi:hypothetical protein